MTNSDVKQNIVSISYYHNRYIHCSALYICEVILSSNNFSKKTKGKVRNIYFELKELSEPWGYWENRTSPDFNMLSEIKNLLNSIYRLVE